MIMWWWWWEGGGIVYKNGILSMITKHKMIEEIGNIFDEKYRNAQTYIIHQCNCVAIKPKHLSYDIVKNFGTYADTYGKRLKQSNNVATVCTRPNPGSIKLHKGIPNVVAFFAQYLYGVPQGGKYHKFFTKRTNDQHLYKGVLNDTKTNREVYFQDCLSSLLELLIMIDDDDDNKPKTIIFPYRIGCGYAGGNWNKYKKMIEAFAIKLRNYNESFRIIIVKKIS